MDNGAISIDPIFAEQHPDIDNQKDRSLRQNGAELRKIDNETKGKKQTSMIPTRLQYAFWSTCTTKLKAAIFILFIIITIILSVLILCFTTKKSGSLCESNFKEVLKSELLQKDSYPRALSTGDLNDDHFLDIVFVDSNRNNIGILLNYGNGSFRPQITFSTGEDSGPRALTLADFNNDFYLDVGVANYDAHNIGIFLGYDDGNFSMLNEMFLGPSRPVSLAVGYFNEDRWIDIVVTNYGTNTVGILFGYGNGSFTNQRTYSTGYDSYPCSVAVAKLNNDDYGDIVVVNYGINNIDIFLGDGKGLFIIEKIYSTGSGSKPYSIVVNDFNNDKRVDLAVVNSGTNDVTIFLGNENGSCELPKTYTISPGSNPLSLVVNDFDGDNELDIAVCNYRTNDVSVLIGYGNGSFAMPTIHLTGIGSFPVSITAGDFDNNNQSDVAVADFGTNKITVLSGYSMIQSDRVPSYATGAGSRPREVVVGDFNNNNELDLAVANGGIGNIGVFLGYGNGSFHEQITYSTGRNSNPIALIARDLDNDHELDLAIGKAGAQSLGIWYGYGNGSFATELNYFTETFSYIISVAVDDFNNDNHLDIAYCDYNLNKIGIVLASGYRSFKNLTTYSTKEGSRPSFIDTGDLNDDGNADIVVSNYGSNTLFIFFGIGDGSFRLHAMYSTGVASLPRSATIVDLNKDNYLDIINSNLNSGTVNVFFGLGNGSFSTPISYLVAARAGLWLAKTADLNNDGWLDIVIVDGDNWKMCVMLGNGSGYFGKVATYLIGPNSGARSFDIGDFNKDNRLDIVVSNYGSRTVAILFGHNDKDSRNEQSNTANTSLELRSTVKDDSLLLGEYDTVFTNKTSYSVGSSSRPSSIAVGHLNNDQYMDLVVANAGNENIGILFQYSNGSFSNEMIYHIGIGSNPEYVLINDFNSDNNSDIAVINPNNDSIIIVLGNGLGMFSRQWTYSTGTGSFPNNLAVGNLNNDNYLDIVVTHQRTDTIGIFFGFDYTVFSRETSYHTGEYSSPSSLVMGDFNNDEHLDIVVALQAADSVGIFLGYGNGSFRSMTNYGNVPFSHPWSVVADDFNNDNQLDIAFIAWGIDSVGVVLGYGNGSFTNPILSSTSFGTRPVGNAVGDFNKDNRLDIATGNPGGNSISILLGYGNGSFQNVTLYSSGDHSGTQGLHAIDINNDTHLDIISANAESSNIGIFFGYGNGSFADQVTFSTGIDSKPVKVISGDFNEDGRLDLVTANSGRGSISILFGFGNGTFGNIEMYETGIGSTPQSVNFGDFNKDSHMDIIVTNLHNYKVAILFGYGDGTFTNVLEVLVGIGSATYDIGIADFNNDSYLDFVIIDFNRSMMQIFLANGSQRFGGQINIPIGTGSNPSAVTLGHFNNDNNLDIVVVNSGFSSINILFGDGKRNFPKIRTYSTDKNSYPCSLAVGDFNNDSFTDIVVVDSESDNIVIFMGYNNETLLLTERYSMGVAAEPVSVSIGDYNGDHRLDIAVANNGTNKICLLYGNGNGTFTNQTWYSLGYNSRPNFIVFQDVNNDGRDDIVVTTYGSDNIQILLSLC